MPANLSIIYTAYKTARTGKDVATGLAAITSALTPANINQTDEYGNTLLHYVMSVGDLELAEELFKHGANILAANQANRLPLDMLVLDLRPSEATVSDLEDGQSSLLLSATQLTLKYCGVESYIALLSLAGLTSILHLPIADRSLAELLDLKQWCENELAKVIQAIQGINKLNDDGVDNYEQEGTSFRHKGTQLLFASLEQLKAFCQSRISEFEPYSYLLNRRSIQKAIQCPNSTLTQLLEWKGIDTPSLYGRQLIKFIRQLNARMTFMEKYPELVHAFDLIFAHPLIVCRAAANGHPITSQLEGIIALHNTGQCMLLTDEAKMLQTLIEETDKKMALLVELQATAAPLNDEERKVAQLIENNLAKILAQYEHEASKNLMQRSVTMRDLGTEGITKSTYEAYSQSARDAKKAVMAQLASKRDSISAGTFFRDRASELRRNRCVKAAASRALP